MVLVAVDVVDVGSIDECEDTFGKCNKNKNNNNNDEKDDDDGGGIKAMILHQVLVHQAFVHHTAMINPRVLVIVVLTIVRPIILYIRVIRGIQVILVFPNL